MTIETKFDLGDTVYFLKEEKIKSDQVYKVFISQDSHERVTESYVLWSEYNEYQLYKDMFILYGEHEMKKIDGEKLFKTREELIKSL